MAKPPRFERVCPTCRKLMHLVPRLDRIYCSKACKPKAVRPDKPVRPKVARTPVASRKTVNTAPSIRRKRQRRDFWDFVHKGERCWIWTGAKHIRGYGACGKVYGDTRAHRVSWLLTNGPIPEGQGVLHKCDTPLCVNPSHLYLGDQKRNAADCKERGRLGGSHKPLDRLIHPQLSKRLAALQAKG